MNAMNRIWISVLVMMGVLAPLGMYGCMAIPEKGLTPAGFEDPQWKVGMEWSYRIEMRSFQGQEFEMKGNATMRINTTEVIKIGNNTYDTFRFSLWGSGTLKGSYNGIPIQGPWTMQGRTHMLKNRTENAQSELYLNVSASMKVTVYMIVNWTPPEDPYNFPMEIGNRWEYKGEVETYNWTYVQGIGYVQGPSHTVSNTTTNFTVVKDEYRTVPAGTFYTYQVDGSTMLLQPIIGAGRQYYSDVVGNAVSIVMLDESSRPTGYYNLTHTNYPPPPGKYGGIAGTVHDAQGPLADVLLVLSSGGKKVAETNSDASGHYEFLNLLPGTYDILANRSGYDDAGKQGITVTAGNVTAVDILMSRPEGEVEVNVRDKDNTPIQGADVEISGPSSVRGKTDASGRFSSTLLEGSYTVEVSKQGYKNATGVITIEPGKKTYANFTLEPARGKLSGKIIDIKTGQPIVNAVVVITQGGTTINQTTTPASGVYEFVLDPGEYNISVSAPGYEPKNETVSIAPGQSVVKDIKLTPKEVKPPEQQPKQEEFPILPVAIVIVVVIIILLLYLMLRKKGKTKT